MCCREYIYIKKKYKTSYIRLCNICYNNNNPKKQEFYNIKYVKLCPCYFWYLKIHNNLQHKNGNKNITIFNIIKHSWLLNNSNDL